MSLSCNHNFKTNSTSEGTEGNNNNNLNTSLRDSIEMKNKSRQKWLYYKLIADVIKSCDTSNTNTN